MVGNDWFYPTSFNSWGDEERDAAARVMASGRLTMGDEVAAFEREFAEFHGMAHAIMVNSGSSANLVAVAALRHLDRDLSLEAVPKAVVPGLAWATTYAPLIQLGFDLVLADADKTWNASTIANLDGARLIVACSVLGNPAPLNAWSEYADKHGAILIEDNCESLGARIGGKLCGTFGVMNTFSFYWSHQIGAVEGGMILTDDLQTALMCRMLRDHGMTRGAHKLDGFDHEYDFRVFGYNVRPLEMHAAIGRAQLKKLPAMIEARRANERTFRTMAGSLPVEFPASYDNTETSPFGIAFMVKDQDTRRSLAHALRSRGIDCRPPTGGSFRLHAYGASWKGQQTPMADEIHRRGMFIGNAPFEISEQIFQAIQVCREVLR